MDFSVLVKERFSVRKFDASRAVEEEKVAAVPGTAFGDSGEGFLRISYAYSLDNLKIAMERFKRFVEKLRAEKNNQ